MAAYSSSTVNDNPGYGVIDGLVGGLIGGIVMGLVAMMITFIMGKGPFWPLALIGHAFQPATATPSQDMGTILLGMIYHLLLSMVLGVILAYIAPYLPTVLPLWVWGMIYAAVVWIIDYIGLLNLLDPTMASLMNPWLFLIVHLIFGGALGWYLGLQGQNRRATAQ